MTAKRPPLKSYNINVCPKKNLGLEEVHQIILWLEDSDLSLVSDGEIKDAISQIAHYYIGLPHGLSIDNKLWRVRLSDTPKERFIKSDDLKYAPADKTKMLRMNYEGIPIFYGAISPSVAFAECELKECQWFHLTEYELKEELRVLAVGDVSNIRFNKPTLIPNDSFTDAYRHILESLSRDDEDMHWAVCLVDAFFADCLSRPGEHNYKITAAISDVLIRKSGCDGLVYPSVKHQGHANFAILASSYDSYMKPLQTSLCMSGKHYGYELRRVWFEDHSKSIEANGNIIW